MAKAVAREVANVAAKAAVGVLVNALAMAEARPL